MKAPTLAAKPTNAPGFAAIARMSTTLDVSLLSVAHMPPQRGLIAFRVGTAIDPNSNFLKHWHQLLLAAIVYEFFLVPFVSTFKPHAEPLHTTEVVVFYLVELLFCADFWVQLNTGYYEDGNIHHDLSRARLKYIKSWKFAADITSILPLSLMPIWVPSGTSKLWLEMTKVLRVHRIPHYISNLDDIYAKHFEALKIFRAIVLTLLLSHYIACVRYSFGVDHHNHNHWLPDPLSVESVQREYLRSLFWGFGMLTGLFEGELPHEIPEFLFTIAVALCGFSVFTYLCGMFFMLSKCESGQTEAAEARINQLKHIMQFHNVPERLQARAIDYLKRYSTDADSNNREAIKLLCPSIAKDLQVELLKDTVARIPVFAGCSDQFNRALTSALEVMFLPAHCTVFDVGDEGDAMYIVQAGVLDVIMSGVKVRELRKGDFLGEMSLFSDRPRSATVVTATYAILYKLSRFHTERVLEGFPQFVGTIHHSVSELIAKADQQVPSGIQTDSQPAHRRTTRRASTFASQLARVMTSEQKTMATVAGENIAVPPPATPMPVLPIRLGQLTTVASTRKMLGQLRRSITTKQQKGVDKMQVFYDQYTRHQPEETTVHTGWKRLLLKKPIDVESPLRLKWLLVLQIVLIYDWVFTPLQVVFQVINFRTLHIFLLHTLVDAVLISDIYLNFNLSFTLNSERITNTSRCATRYLKQYFVIDTILAFPYWVFDTQLQLHGLLRLPRLLRIWRLPGHLREIEGLSHMDSKHKLMLFGILLLMLCHIVACLHFSTTFIEGYSHEHDAWIPTHDIQLRQVRNSFVDYHGEVHEADSPQVAQIASTQYFRSFYYATNVLTGLGKTVEPSSDVQYSIALIFMFSGFIITAVVVDNVQKRFTASAFEQKEFFAVRTRIQLFLRRLRAPLPIHHRLNSYLDYWWAAHRGAHLDDLVAELPVAYRREILRSICGPALQTLALMAGVRPVISQVEITFVDNVRFVLYGQGEIVYHEGDNAHSIFFLLHGSIRLAGTRSMHRNVPEGGFFGTSALHGDEGTASYAETSTAMCGCIVVRLSRANAENVKREFPDLFNALGQLEHRLLDTKLVRFSSDARISRDDSQRARWKIRFLDPLDPDSLPSLAWETWLFVAMTVQWVLVLLHVSYGVDPNHFDIVDSITVFLELSFLVDVYVRMRMGYHEFGNKIMNLREIRRRYVHSKNFAIDIIALIPLFMINWMMRSARYELLNINKLVRLFKVPNQFRQLEQRYLKRTTELRLVKLVYYTFLLVHVAGCVYHDFHSHLSTANLKSPTLESRQTEYGWNTWLLPASLKDADNALKYFSSFFWAFGLMSASYQGELPKTTPQCALSVTTMMCGFFLFAYVIGNFADVIEMVDAENREFNARLGLARHLLLHFSLPEPVAQRLKGFYFFQRYHTITQERAIEQCLPPSLVTDIRLLNLQPMIRKVPFMGGMDPAITRMLVSRFHQELVLKDDFVYRYGDEGTDMYFVFTGKLALMGQRTLKRMDGQRMTTIAGVNEGFRGMRQESEYVTGDFFGENALFSNSPRSATVLSKTSCILYALSRESLNRVFELYPNWKKQVMQTVKIQQKQRRLHGVMREGPSGAIGREDGGGDDLVEMGTPIIPVPRSHQRQLIYVQSSWRRFLNPLTTSFTRGTEAQSRMHLAWLRLIVCCTLFNAALGPYRISVDALERWTGFCILVRIMDIFSGIVFVVDIWFNWHLRESMLSIELYDQDLLDKYKKERLIWDVIAAIPLDYILSIIEIPEMPWLRLLRCVKVANLVSYLNEITRQSVSYEWSRFCTIWLHYVIIMFWAACAYLALGVYGGYDDEWNAWAPSERIKYDDPGNPDSFHVSLRFLRGLFYAVTAFVKKARTFYPLSTGHLVFSILVSFVGVLVMAFMIGEIASLYVSLIDNQVNFRKNQITVELFLSRHKISLSLRKRVHVFLSTLWSSHAGINYESVLEELPKRMRTDTVLYIVQTPLGDFLGSVFHPLMRNDGNGVKAITRLLAQELRFEGYPRGEYIISEGIISGSMYLVVHGHLSMSSSYDPHNSSPVRFKKGQYFGEKGLIALSVSRFSVRTTKACDLFSLSNEIVSELRGLADDGTRVPTHIEQWKSVTRDVLKRHRLEWMNSTLNQTRDDNRDSASTSKGKTHWGALLVDILDGDPNDCGLSFFEPFFQLLTPNGVIFERPRAERQRRESSGRSTSVIASTKARFRDMVLKLSQNDTKSSKSGRSAISTKVVSAKESPHHDRVETFVAED